MAYTDTFEIPKGIKMTEFQSIQRIIVRMPNWLGDCVMATPVLQDLRTRFPHAKITAMCQNSVGGLLLHDPNIDVIFNFKKPNGWIHRKQHNDIIEPIRLEKYDLGILLTNSFSSAWWFWRGKVKKRIGFEGNFRKSLLTEAIPLPKNIETQHLVDTYKDLLLPLGISHSSTAPHLYVNEEERSHARDLLVRCGWNPQKHCLIGINPGAAYGTAKCWLPDRFKALTEKLLSDPRLFVVFFGDASGAPLVEGICEGFPERVLNLAGKTSLRELLALIALCEAFLTNDSGPMHIAAALGTPLVALFGSTSDVKTGPYGDGPKIVIHKRVECSPCYKRVCPIDFRCMKRIETDEVYDALLSVRQHKC